MMQALELLRVPPAVLVYGTAALCQEYRGESKILRDHDIPLVAAVHDHPVSSVLPTRYVNDLSVSRGYLMCIVAQQDNGYRVACGKLLCLTYDGAAIGIYDNLVDTFPFLRAVH